MKFVMGRFTRWVEFKAYTWMRPKDKYKGPRWLTRDQRSRIGKDPHPTYVQHIWLV